MAAEFDVSGWVAAQLAHESSQGWPAPWIIAHSIIRNLSDPKCEGSEEVLKAIMRKREATK